jgi:WD40 repeat protein
MRVIVTSQCEYIPCAVTRCDALLCVGGEDGTVRVWDLRSPGCQREYGSRAAVNTVVLHPNQGELISGACVKQPSVRDDAGGGQQGALGGNH